MNITNKSSSCHDEIRDIDQDISDSFQCEASQRDLVYGGYLAPGDHNPQTEADNDRDKRLTNELRENTNQEDRIRKRHEISTMEDGVLELDLDEVTGDTLAEGNYESVDELIDD